MMNNSKDLTHTGFVAPEKTSLLFDEDKGKLYKFNRLSIEVIRFGDPFPAAFIKTKRHNWQGYMPSRLFPFLFYKPSLEKLNSDKEGLRRFAEYRADIYKTISTWVGKETVDLVTMFTSRHWRLYTLLINGGKESHELIRALGYLISLHLYFHSLKSRRYKRSERSLIKKKRKDILEYFGFPRKEAVVKIFSKISPAACDFYFFQDLRNLLNKSPEAIRRLSFYQRYNGLSLSVLLNNDIYPKLHNSLIDQICQRFPNEEDVNSVALLFDIVRMQKFLSEHHIPQRHLFFKTFSAINVVHEEMVDLMMKVSTGKECQYGSGFLPDVKNDELHLEGITNYQNLLLEGKTMHHCIASYHQQLKRKEGFCVAKMVIPERLTILYRQEKERCRLMEVKGKYNTNPQAGSLQIIKKWIEGHPVSSDFDPQWTLFDEIL